MQWRVSWGYYLDSHSGITPTHTPTWMREHPRLFPDPKKSHFLPKIFLIRSLLLVLLKPMVLLGQAWFGLKEQHKLKDIKQTDFQV